MPTKKQVQCRRFACRSTHGTGVVASPCWRSAGGAAAGKMRGECAAPAFRMHGEPDCMHRSGKRKSGAAVCKHGASRAHAQSRRLGALRWRCEGVRRRPDGTAHAEGVVPKAAWLRVAATVHAERNTGWGLKERGHSILQARRRRRAGAVTAGGFAAPARGMHREGAVSAGRRRRKSGRMRNAVEPLVQRRAEHAIRLAVTPLRQRGNAQLLRSAGTRHGP